MKNNELENGEITHTHTHTHTHTFFSLLFSGSHTPREYCPEAEKELKAVGKATQSTTCGRLNSMATCGGKGGNNKLDEARSTPSQITRLHPNARAHFRLRCHAKRDRLGERGETHHGGLIKHRDADAKQHVEPTLHHRWDRRVD